MDKAQKFSRVIALIEAELQRRQNLLADHQKKRDDFLTRLGHFSGMVAVGAPVLAVGVASEKIKELLQLQSDLIIELEELQPAITGPFQVEGLDEDHLKIVDLILQNIKDVFEKALKGHRALLDQVLDMYNEFHKLEPNE